MHFTSSILALAGLSLVASAPTKHRYSKRGTILIQQTVVEPSITVIQENLDLVNQLALTAEQEFSSLVQSQLALVQEVETIKNNIRVNHFLSRFDRVNTVIVCVTQVIDVRNPNSHSNRYMVNQLLADHGSKQTNSKSSIVVMVSAASPMTVGVASPSLDLAGLLGAAATAIPSNVVENIVASATAVASAASNSTSTFSNSTDISSLLNVAAFDPKNPFGQIGQSVILPYGSQPPSLPNGAQLFADPAAIILPNQANLFVEDISQFNQDCSLWSSNGLSLFNLQSSLAGITEITQIEVSGLVLGSSSSLNQAALDLLNVGALSTTTTTTTLGSTASSTSTTTSTSTSAASAAPPASSNGVGVQVVPVPPAA